MRILLSFAFVLCLLACEQKPAPVAAPITANSEIPPPYVEVDTTDGTQFVTVIVEGDEKDVVLSGTDQQIVDSLVRLRVAQHNVGVAGDQAIDLAKYKRQYFLSLNAKGEKEVEVNCFCHVHDTDVWKERRARASDGGSCYFNLHLNLATRRISSFRVNGEA